MLGKGKKSIGARNGRCGVQKRFDKDLDAIEKRIPEFFFTSQRTFFSRKCFVFKSFKFRCDETLGNAFLTWRICHFSMPSEFS